VFMSSRALPPIGARIKALREAAAISQQELANRAGLSLSVVFQMEQGKKKDPKLSTLLALAGALQMDVGRLAAKLVRTEGDEQPNPAPKGRRRRSSKAT